MMHCGLVSESKVQTASNDCQAVVLLEYNLQVDCHVTFSQLCIIRIYLLNFSYILYCSLDLDLTL